MVIISYFTLIGHFDHQNRTPALRNLKLRKKGEIILFLRLKKIIIYEVLSSKSLSLLRSHFLYYDLVMILLRFSKTTMRNYENINNLSFVP